MGIEIVEVEALTPEDLERAEQVSVKLSAVIHSTLIAEQNSHGLDGVTAIYALLTAAGRAVAEAPTGVKAQLMAAAVQHFATMAGANFVPVVMQGHVPKVKLDS